MATEHVLYAELTPEEFRQRLREAPIAYLPLGTLEWHGEHLPLGSDGLQSAGFFEHLARRVGGIVLPMLFLGPDRVYEKDGKVLYGMDFHDNYPGGVKYESRQLDGSAYWVSDELFRSIVEAILKQLSRAGFRIVVGHGHGPSTVQFSRRFDEWSEQFGLRLLNCWGSPGDSEGMGLMVDHAAMNETSLVWALRPDLVRMENLPEDPDVWPIGIGGKDPRKHASREKGEQILTMQLDRMEGLLREELKRL